MKKVMKLMLSEFENYRKSCFASKKACYPLRAEA
jgi:hypothetical protein